MVLAIAVLRLVGEDMGPVKSEFDEEGIGPESSDSSCLTTEEGAGWDVAATCGL